MSINSPIYTETIEKIKELKAMIQMVDAGMTGDYDITDWEYKFIQDQLIFLEENKDIEDMLTFSPAIMNKVEELWEKFKDYL